MPVYSAQVTNLESIGPIIDLAVTPHPAAAKAMEAQPTGLPKSILVSALIDTGASHSVIQQSVADGLGLQPIGKGRNRSSANVLAGGLRAGLGF